MNTYFTLTLRKELSNFNYVTKVEKGSFTDVIYLYIHTVKPNTNVLGRFASFNNVSSDQDWILWRLRLGRWRAVRTRSSVLSPFSLSLFTTIHCWTSWMHLWIDDLDCKASAVLNDMYETPYRNAWWHLQSGPCTLEYKIGPNTDPCGTPQASSVLRWTIIRHSDILEPIWHIWTHPGQDITLDTVATGGQQCQRTLKGPKNKNDTSIVINRSK